MAQLDVDMTEIGLIMMGLSYIEDDRLNENAKAARARLAYKLGQAAGEMLVGETDG
jgi:hypothetical protein